MTKTYAVILAGGQGLRLGGGIPKQFLPLKDKPIIMWSIEQFSTLAGIDHLVIVCPAKEQDRLQEILANHKPSKTLSIVTGGKTRQESCYNALISQRFNDDDILMFHDAARPFISAQIISNCLEETKQHGAAAVYVPAIDTITEIENGFVQDIPQREKLYYTQTPQAFRFNIIMTAYAKIKQSSILATDDVSLAINAGFVVKAITGEYTNIKITTQHDYDLAQFMLDNQKKGEFI